MERTCGFEAVRGFNAQASHKRTTKISGYKLKLYAIRYYIGVLAAVSYRSPQSATRENANGAASTQCGRRHARQREQR